MGVLYQNQQINARRKSLKEIDPSILFNSFVLDFLIVLG
jgi:hypothetical protein